jgi:hypothetical protein
VGRPPVAEQNCSYLTIPNEVVEIFRRVPPSVRLLSTFGVRPDDLAGSVLARWAIVRSPGGMDRSPDSQVEDRHCCQVQLLRFRMLNRSPMRWPKLVGGFHLPSAVCAPSEIAGRFSPP